ncbi:MAG: hypothetical protein H6735_12780 [Alphaproteobacteria bacterium]|nr:hypothetical protein [Alphaproteobacteria bacterium]
MFVPRDLRTEVERARALLAELVDEGALDASHGPGPRSAALVPDGFSRAGLELPDGEVGFWANRQGGFTVRCPVDDTPVVAAFARAHEAWRARTGPPPPVACTACGATHRADELVFRPEVAWGPFALVFGQVGSAAATPEEVERVTRALGPCAVVLRRG